MASASDRGLRSQRRCTLPACDGLSADGMCPHGYGRSCEATKVTMGLADRLDRDGLHELAVVARKYADDRPRWWHRFTRRAG